MDTGRHIGKDTVTRLERVIRDMVGNVTAIKEMYRYEEGKRRNAVADNTGNH